MNTLSLSGTDLNESLSALTTNHLYALIPALSGCFHAFPDKSSVYEISGVTRKENTHCIHFTDSVLGIDHVEVPLLYATSKMREDLEFAINKIS